ncbi:AmmeMemoRadiSam system radical SAM enzyme [Marinobacterium sp. AK62]|uniref:AmmeMemoRadiSam system radical SAM enzyme n=1 Tax=Marinobacterium alkalitolerans TaxID=1542925 RepID=A0ABS3ZBG7_9GAMM|nr:AmmeMemoRadiSam system radical SAM enzyme [Marinobacterium alkalitolerans]MBP0049043.1 AmmeMemoRadiSam system radical SAM enzyme [Marinobacterium alkalitolerans]
MDQRHTVTGRFWHRLENGKLQCDLCPRFCQLNPGQRGLCFVRGREDDEIKLYSYGLSSGFCIDPIEKKPLNHFLPGTPVLSFGTAGCNLACRFCQNWDISRSRETARLSDSASPEALARTAQRYDCRSIAFTYNDPVIFHEYAVDVAQACRELGIKSVAVSAGYVTPEPRREFYAHMDAANIDLKAFTESFYKKICGGSLAPVLDTLAYIHHDTDVWLEITTLLIPGENDSDAEIRQLSRWVAEQLGPEVPLHFTAFHPDWKMLDHPSTPLSTLRRARQIALEEGLAFVYTGNLPDREGNTTYCIACHEPLIQRAGYTLTAWNLDQRGCCRHCGHPLAGYLEPQPGHWGARRLPVRIGD